ncbi:MAG: FAD-binding protein [Acidimicrobiia bacterium]|nr:FAD-binding protein [Actinomycetota bacterium]NDE80680.1 FAD-binding protein [Actinomycetota bacterium]NDH47622.1 FAD-binding protein [Acidimicrobiia bacterium]
MPVLRPTSVDQLLDILANDPSASVLAGGTDLMVEVNLHGRRPATVVSLRSLDELTEWSHRSGRVTIGAGLPYADMEKGPLAQLVPALAQAARTVGSPQIRAAGTIGGNLGTCSPAGDTLPVLAALNATIHVLHRDGVRDVPFSDFMIGVKRNCLRPGEIVHSVTVPVVEGWQGYAKVGTRNAMVISTASACLVHDSVEGLVSIALGAVGPTIIRATEAESWLARNVSLRGSLSISSDIATEFGRRVAAEARPISDHRSTADYRRHAISVLARRLLERAAI